MPEVQVVKRRREGGCHECRARFSGKQLEELLRHTGRTGHKTWWVDNTNWEITPSPSTPASRTSK